MSAAEGLPRGGPRVVCLRRRAPPGLPGRPLQHPSIALSAGVGTPACGSVHRKGDHGGWCPQGGGCPEVPASSEGLGLSETLCCPPAPQGDSGPKEVLTAAHPPGAWPKKRDPPEAPTAPAPPDSRCVTSQPQFYQEGTCTLPAGTPPRPSSLASPRGPGLQFAASRLACLNPRKDRTALGLPPTSALGQRERAGSGECSGWHLPAVLFQ